MKKLLITLSVTLGLTGCGVTQAEKDKYDEILLKGEVVSSSTNRIGVTTTLVRHENKLYTCTQNAALHKACVTTN